MNELSALIYKWAAWGYVGTLMVVVACLYRGQRTGKVNLWHCVTTTKGDKEFTDRRKLFETGAFVVSTVAFSYLVVVDRMNELFLTIYMSAWVASAAMRDRAQRLDKLTDKPKTDTP